MADCIPVHFLNERAKMGWEVRHFVADGRLSGEIEKFPVHRDDNYFFLLVERGEGSIDVDFNRIVLVERNLYFVAPGQVHYHICGGYSVSWMVSVAPSLIPKDCIEVFESNLYLQRPCVLEESRFALCTEILGRMEKQCKENVSEVFYKKIIACFLDAFLYAVAQAYLCGNALSVNNISRPVQIDRGFRKLLRENALIHKTPSYYASKLNVSESYLNESVKKVTGFTVTYWIRGRIMLEAKRLLCFSGLNAQEIACTLGYEDPAYFSKIFRKSEGMTPLAFRESCLK